MPLLLIIRVSYLLTECIASWDVAGRLQHRSDITVCNNHWFAALYLSAVVGSHIVYRALHKVMSFCDY